MREIFEALALTLSITMSLVLILALVLGAVRIPKMPWRFLGWEIGYDEGCYFGLGWVWYMEWPSTWRLLFGPFYMKSSMEWR